MKDFPRLRTIVISFLVLLIVVTSAKIAFAQGYEIEQELRTRSDEQKWADNFLKALIKDNQSLGQTFNQIIQKHGFETESLEDGLDELTNTNNQTNIALADELKRRIENSRIGYQVYEEFNKLIE